MKYRQYARPHASIFITPATLGNTLLKRRALQNKRFVLHDSSHGVYNLPKLLVVPIPFMNLPACLMVKLFYVIACPADVMVGRLVYLCGDLSVLRNVASGLSECAFFVSVGFVCLSSLFYDNSDVSSYVGYRV